MGRDIFNVLKGFYEGSTDPDVLWSFVHGNEHVCTQLDLITAYSVWDVHQNWEKTESQELWQVHTEVY